MTVEASIIYYEVRECNKRQRRPASSTMRARKCDKRQRRPASSTMRLGSVIRERGGQHNLL